MTFVQVSFFFCFIFVLCVTSIIRGNEDRKQSRCQSPGWIEWCSKHVLADPIRIVIFEPIRLFLICRLTQSSVSFQLYRLAQKHFQAIFSVFVLKSRISEYLQWLVQSRQHVNLPEERLQESNWPPRPLVRAHLPPVESRNHTDTGQELLLSVKSGDTRRAQSFWSENSPSKD